LARAFRRRLAAPFLAAVAAGLVLAACEGSNAFAPGNNGGGSNNGGGGTGQTDATPPTVAIEKPDSASNVAVGEQLYVQAHVTDNVALDSVVISAFELRGSAELGTLTAIPRFTSKTVRLGGTATVVKDTVIKRFLDPVADSSRASNVRVVVAAYDTARNVKADTTLLNIGGPRVQILGPAAGSEYNGGAVIAVNVLAVDSAQLIRSVRVRGTGAFTFDTTLTVSPALQSVNDTVVVPIPATVAGTAVQGTETLVAIATTAGGKDATSTPLAVTIKPAQPDITPPQVTFNADVPGRVETDDTLHVTAQATDAVRIDTLGITVFAIHPRAGGEDTLATFTRKVRASSDSANVFVAAVPLTGLDTVTLRFAVTAWATDPAGNCGAAVSPNSPQAQPCVARAGYRVANVAGWNYVTFVARGLTVPPPNPGDVLADLLADSNRVYLSNFTRNRLDILPLGSTQYSAPVRVGSEPWGLALGRFNDSLYVANSGGTNISVVPLTGAVLAEAQDKRIFTRNERLFSVDFATDTSQAVNAVTLFDYSDRPQFIAQASNGLLVYSTKPTPADTNGTVRIYDARKLRSEIFTGYVDRHTAGKAIVVNADSAFQTPGKDVLVCPRRRFGDTSDPACIVGRPSFVSDSLTRMRMQAPNASGGKWDTRLDIGANITEVGLSDTTFVAVSGNRNYVAVGEGARQNARIPLFNAPTGGDSLVLVGDVRDLISNAAERVIGLGINYDGSLGVARGSQAYYFGPTLRLQGVVAAGSPTGGVAMHPANAGYPGGSFRLSFVSGIDDKAPYVDVIDNFNFFRVKRIYTRDPVVGAMAVAPRAPGDASSVALRIYALTSKGVLALTVTSADLVP
jgi:hypothetical protein